MKRLNTFCKQAKELGKHVICTVDVGSLGENVAIKDITDIGDASIEMGNGTDEVFLADTCGPDGTTGVDGRYVLFPGVNLSYTWVMCSTKDKYVEPSKKFSSLIEELEEKATANRSALGCKGAQEEVERASKESTRLVDNYIKGSNPLIIMVDKGTFSGYDVDVEKLVSFLAERYNAVVFE